MVTLAVSDRLNASSLLDRRLELGDGDKIAIHVGERSITYAELARDVNRMGHLLLQLGAVRESRVLLVLDDTPAFPISFLGAMRIGAIPIPVSPADRPENFRYFGEDSYAQFIVAEAPLVESIIGAFGEQSPPIMVAANGEAEGAIDLNRALRAQPDELTAVATHRDDVAFWLYSSGSTGRPKGVVHLHHDMAYTYETYGAQVLGIDADDVTVSTTKLYHAYGLGNGMTFPYSVGATTVLLPGRPDPVRTLAAIEHFRPTMLFSVPALYTAMLNSPGALARDLGSLRLCVSAAEALPPVIFRRWKEAYGVEILDGIGSTEMLHIFCSNMPGKGVPGASGRPVPGYELKLVDEDGLPVGDDDVGDLLVRGDSCAAYYWHHHEKTKMCMRGDWYLTGDRYRRTPDGDYVFEGRSDDMIKSGGLWVSPAEVEAVLMDHPAVSEAAVIGVTHDDRSRIKAYVICRERTVGGDELAEQLREHCKNRLRRYEYPHLVEFVPDLPRTSTGKIQRFKLRELSAAGS